MAAPPRNQDKSHLKSTIKDQSGAGKVRIGDMLKRQGLITASDLEKALAFQKKHKMRLGSILVKMGFVSDDDILNTLTRLHNFPAINISREPPTEEALSKMSFEVAARYTAFPLRVIGKSLQVTMAEPTDTSAIENLQMELKMGLSICVSTEKDIFEAYKTHYKISEEEFNTLSGEDEKPEDEEDDEITQIDSFGDLADQVADEMGVDTYDEVSQAMSADDAPIIKLVNGILSQAVIDGVSDVHIEPFEKSLQVRYRLDGSLYKSMNLPLNIKNALNSRIKILASLDITERRVPQDGRIKMRVGKKSVDFRVSSLPTLFGESIVLRILDKSSLNVDLTKLGFEPAVYKRLQGCLDRPQGLLLVTGPTGSGKTVTLYSALNTLNKEDTKILTAEDPVEFNFKGINQVNVHKEIGMTFPAALKAFLRQDPDIIMVGEIRDIETAEIAIKAAMTGHLVFSTLHTNDCPATVARLVDIGIPPFMVASAVTMIQSQRLGRKLCPACRREMTPDDLSREELLAMGFKEKEVDTLKLYMPTGCGTCRGGGYKGRVGFFELMEITDEVAKAISAEVPEDQLRKVAIHEGMYTLREAALEKARQGITSPQEVTRRTVVTEESLPAYLVNPDVENYDDGDAIIRQGNSDKDFFKLLTGAVIVVKDGKKIAEITQPGEYFGEMSAISGEARSASIISKGRSKVKRFPGDKLLELIETVPQVGTHLFNSLVSRLEQANSIIVKLANERMRKAS
ncbi:MAG: type IV-A pilus assembly ATPase PilB [Proteobacteria bacterium]|nr:type IV-A pilus assembly ATPase PilB [Pseudomonadota bacterium]MBU1709494.1 type IV-A pilus assembly ATPase PilB [Pseudomonadota bacterium]